LPLVAKIVKYPYIYLVLIQDKDSLIYEVALSRITGIGNVKARTLLQHFGNAKEVFSASTSVLSRVEGLGHKTIQAIQKLKDFSSIEQELVYAEKNNIQLLSITSPDYPDRLKQCADAPLILYFKGNVSLNHLKIVAIVGTRKNTVLAQSLTEKLVQDLSAQACLIVSGLAFGIDGIAHRASLQSGLPTVGVLAHGLDRIYPSEHRSLAKKMIDQGGLLTEFPIGTIPDKQNFPRRNRIVAGMADVTVVIETGIKGGAMITANLAFDYNRDVAAVPGRPTDAQSAGCNELIKTNRAQLITGAADLMSLMNWDEHKIPKAKQQNLFLQLTDEQKLVTDLLSNKDSIHLDELNAQMGMNSSALAAILLSLELDGLVQPLPGKRYRLV